MADMDKLVSDIESLKEARIRHDERLKATERGNQKAMESISKLEGELNEKFDTLLTEMREGFSKVHERIDDIEGSKRDQIGYERGVSESRKAMLKQFGLWVSMGALAIAFLAWWVTK